MTQKGSTIRQVPRVIFSLLFCTLVFLGFDQAAHAQPEPTEEGRVTVVLTDFRVQPDATQAKAGRLTFSVMNKGVSTHELVIIRTDLDPAALPRKEAKEPHSIGTGYLVIEDDVRIETIDEIEEFPAGTRQKKAVFLDPGRYVLFCNIPGHYDKGMYASLHIVR